MAPHLSPQNWSPCIPVIFGEWLLGFGVDKVQPVYIRLISHIWQTLAHKKSTITLKWVNTGSFLGWQLDSEASKVLIVCRSLTAVWRSNIVRRCPLTSGSGWLVYEGVSEVCGWDIYKCDGMKCSTSRFQAVDHVLRQAFTCLIKISSYSPGPNHLNRGFLRLLFN